MTKQDKNEIIAVLKGKFEQYSNFYITNTDALSVAEVNKLRRECFNKKIEMKVAKNSLIRKAMEAIDDKRYAPIYDSLHGVSAILFSEDAKVPALTIISYREKSKKEKPTLKAAYIDTSVFVGDDQLEALKTLKSKTELIGEIVGLLQSPINNVLSAINGGNKVAGLVKALEDRYSEAASAE